MSTKIESQLPFYSRPPQKFQRYEEQRFEYPHGTGTVRIAHFLDKKGKPQQMDAQIIWDQIPFSKEWQAIYGKVTESPYVNTQRNT